MRGQNTTVLHDAGDEDKAVALQTVKDIKSLSFNHSNGRFESNDIFILGLNSVDF